VKNGVVHFEIYATDADKLQKFYTELFDWKAEHFGGPVDYRLVRTVDTDERGMPKEPGGINGGLLHSPEGFKPGSLVSYVSVESLDASVAKAQKLGAKVTKPKAPVPGMGWFAMLVDPQGNNFAMWQTDSNAK